MTDSHPGHPALASPALPAAAGLDAPDHRADGPARPEVVLIAAVARNGCIGKGNELVFRDPADQRHFRAATLGHPVLMGRKTWDSLPPRFRPLPDRRNLVMTRQPGLSLPGAETVPGLAEALRAVHGAPRLFVIGGGEVYAQAMPWADELLLTEVDADLPGDCFFPAWPRHRFDEVLRQSAQGSDGQRFDFVRYRRRPDGSATSRLPAG